MRKIIFLGLVFFGFAVGSVRAAQIVPAATTPNGKYTVVLDNNPSYSGPVDIKSWSCDNRNPTVCTAPTETKPWKNAAGQPYLFSNNQLVIDLAGLNIPERIYYLQVATTPGNYSAATQIDVTRNATYPTFSDNLSSTLTLTNQVIVKYLSTQPILDLPGPSGQTINQVYASPQLTTHQKAKAALGIVCGVEPSPTTDPNLIANYRHCMAAYAYMLMSYHAYFNQNQWVTPYAYIITFQMDSLASTTADPPLHGNQGAQYRLGQTAIVQSYINDFGMGVLSGLGWLKYINRIDQAYCTSDETPFDPGRICKTIDLSARIRGVGKKIISDTAGYETYRTDIGFLSRSSTGRAVAAYLTGDQQLFAASWTKVLQYVPQVLDPELAANSSILNLSDLFQHAQVVFNLNNWVVPAEFTGLSQNWLASFFGSYFDPQFPIADLDNNWYSETNFRAKFPQLPVYNCGQTGFGFHFNHNNTGLVRTSGEQLSDGVTTIAPALYLLFSQSNQTGLSQEVLDINAHLMRTMIQKPPDPQDEMCDPNTIFGNPKSRLSVALRTFAYLYFTTVGFAHSPYKAFTDPPLFPGDVNDDGRINAQDLRLLIPNWFNTSPDLTADNKVNSLDAALIISNFGR